MDIRRRRQRVWFELWIREGYSVRQLSQQSGYTKSTLRRIIHYWLARPPKESQDYHMYQYLVMDGTYLDGRTSAVVAIADSSCNRIVSGQYGVKEGQAEMEAYCASLTARGLNPTSVTIDGLPQVHRMVLRLWPWIIVQRCLVHIQRQGLAWCRHRPKEAAARHLRTLFLRVTKITSVSERDDFLETWEQWEHRFGRRIAARPERGRVFSDIKRARSMLQKALPFMFAYLDDPSIPSSTNWLESYFSRLKMRYRQHRGLHPKMRNNYFLWYFHLCHK